MAESPARYCSNCGNELNLNDRFCQNCGTPVQQAATVPTPEADVPVPPPPQVGATAPPPPQARGTQQSWPRRHPLLTGCLGIVGVFTLLIIALVAAVANSGGGGNGGGNVAEKPKQDHKAAQPAQPEKKEQPEEEEQKQSQQQPQQEDKASKPAPQPQYASVGQKATVDDEAYQVNKAWKQNGIHSALENLEGTFVVVDFTFYNAGSETRTLDETALKLQDSQGRSYEVSQDNSMVVPISKDIFLEDVSPGVSKQGRAIFSVSPTANGFVLVCSHTNWMSSAKPAKIKLGF